MRLYCIWALLLFAAPAAAQAAQPAAAATTGYTIFARGAVVGREAVTVRSDASGTTITAQGRLAAPLNVVMRQADFRYGPDWTAQAFSLEADANGADISLRTAFKDGTAVTEGSVGGNKVATSVAVAPRTVILPNNVFAAYVALAQRLQAELQGGELRVYVVPAAEITVRVAAVHPERMQIGTTFLDVRRYELIFANPDGDLPVTLTAGRDGSLIRVSMPGQVEAVREDVASSTSRTQIYSNPGDEPVTIPATGFNLGATLTRPKGGAPRLPAVVLLSGSGASDRDGMALGIPTLGQLAGAFAEAGFLAVRYDKRGYGQSGGRAESATLNDYAEDARAVVRWLANRNDVDPKRIAVVGHSEGAWVALLAARERRIAAVVTIAAPASTGAELVLEQQQSALAQMNLPADERDKRIALQKQIQAAVLTGKGWESVPADLRKQADTPWFQSLLAFDPAKALEDVRQPLLVVHGALDRQVPVAHADRLADLARRESDSKTVEVIVVKGVNHLLVPAFTGEVSEYSTLTDRSVSKDVTGAVSGWLTRTFAAIR